MKKVILSVLIGLFSVQYAGAMEYNQADSNANSNQLRCLSQMQRRRPTDGQKHQRWTEEEKQLLISAFAIYGTRWNEIVKVYFPNRNSSKVKDKYYYLVRHQGAQGQVNKTQKLKQLISDDTGKKDHFGEYSYEDQQQ